jgi:predicted SAM-dependent methyltransferase
MFGKGKKIEKHNQLVRDRNKERGDVHDRMREHIAAIYLVGEGLEIGGLHKPLITPPQAKVKYLDRMSAPDLRKQYPEIDAEPMVEVEIVDNGETMKKVRNESQDFVVASHFFEHSADSIMAFKNLMRVTKKDGFIFLVIPDKRFTFDKDRPVTPFAHILEDHEFGPDRHKRAHFAEWAEYVDGKVGHEEIDKHVEHLLEMDYSIHYHVWSPGEMLDYFMQLKGILNNSFDVKLFAENMTEMIFVLQKKA